MFGGQRREAAGVVERGDRIVHRTRSDDDDQAVIVAGEDRGYFVAVALHASARRAVSGSSLRSASGEEWPGTS